MKETLEEINDCIRECLPIMVFTSWLIMVMFCIKILYTASGGK